VVLRADKVFFSPLRVTYFVNNQICHSQEGSEWMAKYKTAASIKEKLKSMGY
jgi:hypothetical protein